MQNFEMGYTFGFIGELTGFWLCRKQSHAAIICDLIGGGGRRHHVILLTLHPRTCRQLRHEKNI
jgi:hypothetical protein